MRLVLDFSVKNDQLTRESTDQELETIVARVAEEAIMKLPWVVDLLITAD